MVTPDPHAATDPAVVTRSEEELRLSTTRRPVERVRLRKVVVTDEVTITVAVRREEFRLERLPVDDAAAPLAPNDPAQAGESLVHKFVLHEEVPEVQMRVVARERARGHKTLRSDQVEVTEQLRKERINIDAADSGP